MNKLQRTAEILRAEAMGGGPPMLSDLALRVRASIRGDSDPWPREELDRALEALQYRLSVWSEPEDLIDNGVRLMVIAAVSMIEKELQKRIAEGWSY